MTKRLTTIDHDHHPHHESDDEEEIIEVFPAIIFDTSFCGEPVPTGFNAVKIVIDGKIKGDLSWKKEREAASAYIRQGLRIFWEIDLGLSGPLDHALSNRTQFLALTLSLEHFRNTLWKEFQKDSVGLNLYRGPLDFSHLYCWDEEQTLNLQEWIKDHDLDVESLVKETGLEIADFADLTPEKIEHFFRGKNLLKFFCRDAIGEYLNLLALALPDNLPLFLLFDTTAMKDDFLVAQLLIKERYPRFHLAVKNSSFSYPEKIQVLGGELSWEGRKTEKGLISKVLNESAPVEKSKLGFCLPRMSICLSILTCKLQETFNVLQTHKIPFRVIPEVDLAVEWDGLDYLVIDTQTVEEQFKRKLQGFCAAGGTVVFLGQSLGLAEEIPFEKFFHR